MRADAALNFPDVEVNHFDVMTLMPGSFSVLYANDHAELAERIPWDDHRIMDLELALNPLVDCDGFRA